jgi:hypothetical protein
MELFEKATRQKYRYLTAKGSVTTEDLWDLSLLELDKTAVALNREIKEIQEESFLAKSTTDERMAEQLEVLKTVIKYKQEEEQNKRLEAERKAERARLLEILDQKQGEQLMSLSIDEIRERLNAVK